MANFIETNMDNIFISGSLDSLLPKDSECRIIREYMKKLNFDEVNKRYKNDKTGRPCYDPKKILSIWIRALMRQISSSVKISSLCETDIEFRWLCEDKPPKKSTLSDFRSKYLEELLDISSKITVGLREANLIRGKGMVTDGTVYRAAGSRKKIIEKEKLEKKIEKKRQELKRLLEQEDDNETNDINEKIEYLTELLSYSDKKNLNYICQSESEAHYMLQKDKSYGPGYNVQYSMDDETGAILDQRVIEQGNDHGNLKNNYDEVKKIYPEIKRVGADSGYHKSEDLHALHEDGVHTYVADPNKAKSPGIYDDYQAEHFIKEEQGYRCPEGHLLNKREKKDKNTFRYYGAPCQTCKQKDKCMKNPNNRKGRTINENIYKAAIIENDHQSKDEIGKLQKKARSIFAEGVIMRIKEVFGINRLKTWGKKHVKCELTLYRIAHNFLLWCGLWMPLSIIKYPQAA